MRSHCIMTKRGSKGKRALAVHHKSSESASRRPGRLERQHTIMHTEFRHENGDPIELAVGMFVQVPQGLSEETKSKILDWIAREDQAVQRIALACKDRMDTSEIYSGTENELVYLMPYHYARDRDTEARSGVRRCTRQEFRRVVKGKSALPDPPAYSPVSPY